MAERRSDQPFSLTRGGPFHQLAHRLRFIAPSGHLRWVALAAIAWIPLIVASLLRIAAGASPHPLVLDPSVHARFVISLPLLVVAETVLEARVHHVVRLLHEERIAERAKLDAILRRVEQLRDARVVEVALAIVALVGGQLALWGVAGPSGYLHGPTGDAAPLRTFESIWYAVLALPLLQFLAMRWLWRWLLWTYVLVRLSRLRLETNALHPDQAAGLKFLSFPVDAFAVFIAANVAVAAAARIIPLQQGEVTLQALGPRIAAFVGFCLAVACGPLLLFAGKIFRARYRTLVDYHVLARDYVRSFHHKWFGPPRGHPATGETGADSSLLGTPDLQSLHDMDGSFQLVESTKVLPFGLRTIVHLVAGAAVPIVPLLFVTIPLSEILAFLGRMLQLPML